MNDEKENTLRTKFPSVFPPYNPLYPLGPHNNTFSFDIGDGWYQLMYDAAAKIEPILLTLSVRDRAQYHAVQVKEKFGTLRFYADMPQNPEIEAAIREAEDRSETTCESCGEKGTLRQEGWLKTLCDRCHMKSAISNIMSIMRHRIETYDHVKNNGTTQVRYRFKDNDQILEDVTNNMYSRFKPRGKDEKLT